MGLVYSPERVEAGLVPADANGQAQRDAAIVFGESMQELCGAEDSALIMFMVYGSATRQYAPTSLATRRSDVDLIAVTNYSDDDGAQARKEVTARAVAVKRQYHVDVSPFVFTREELEGGALLNPFYAEHLCITRGVMARPSLSHQPHDTHCIGLKETRQRNTLLHDTIFRHKLPFVEAWPFAQDVLASRRNRFQEQLDLGVPDLSKLKGPFEAPRNIGRMLSDLYLKYVAEHDKEGYDPVEDDLMMVTKDHATDGENLFALAEFTGKVPVIGDDIDRLTDLDEQYSGILEQTVAGDMTIAQYERWLQGVQTESFERAFALAEGSQLIVSRLVELAQLDPDYDRYTESHFIEYDGVEIDKTDEYEEAFRAGQIVPAGYDLDRLLFSIAPREPEIVERYQQRLAARAERRARDYAEWQEDMRRREIE